MKRIILFCDGTWNSADQTRNGAPSPTNVVKLALRVARNDGRIPQLVYYNQGVGTGNSLDRLTGGAFGDGLESNIHSAYRFLLLNYELGDELFVFGFSRGAYTARSLTGLIRKCGILRPRNVDQYSAALRTYCDPFNPDDEGPREFRRRYCISEEQPIPIKFVGVWDTVGALGIPMRGLRWLTAHKYRFHDVQLSGTVENAYQALAIDERRAPFDAARWAYMPKPGQRVEQMWFAGVHSDIGGGYPPGEWGLSDITLAWMRDKAQAAGLAIDPETDRAFPPAPNHHGILHQSKKGLYRITAGIDRVIGKAALPLAQPDETTTQIDPTQSLHPTVRQRWDEDPAYRPRNLLDYFRLIRDPRGDTEVRGVATR